MPSPYSRAIVVVPVPRWEKPYSRAIVLRGGDLDVLEVGPLLGHVATVSVGRSAVVKRRALRPVDSQGEGGR